MRFPLLGLFDAAGLFRLPISVRCLVELFLQVEHGRLTGVAFRGDFFSAEEPEELERLLTGCPLELEACRRALEGVDLSRYFHGLDRERFLQLLCQGR